MSTYRQDCARIVANIIDDAPEGAPISQLQRRLNAGIPRSSNKRRIYLEESRKAMKAEMIRRQSQARDTPDLFPKEGSQD
ncbi:MAG: hypothetical protein AAGA31_10755 [Bacteroidota bacterium]